MTKKMSLARDRIRIVLVEGISQSAIESFKFAGYTNIRTVAKAPDSAELKELIADAHIIGIRSRTDLNQDALDRAKNLFAIGCFCIGTNQVNLTAAAELGIPVFNAPFSNTRSVAELVMGEIVMLFRKVLDKSTAAHRSEWDKTSQNCFEVRGKTLGIIGYGNIGTQLSTLAEAFGMNVIYYDLIDRLSHGNARSVRDIDVLLEQSDVVSLHVPETAATNHMISSKQIARMKKGSYLINNSRGSVVDIDALTMALKSNHLMGAAIDVFPQEPKSNQEKFKSSLQGLPNVILTPHIGGSTEEAQERIGEEVTKRLLDYSNLGTTLGSVNFPQVFLSEQTNCNRYMHVHNNIPGVLARVIEIFSSKGLNIYGQHLQTNGNVGYLVVDAEQGNLSSKQILNELRKIQGTIRARLLH